MLPKEIGVISPYRRQVEKIKDLMNNDKKNIHNKLNYIMLTNIGEAKIAKNYSKEKILDALQIL